MGAKHKIYRLLTKCQVWNFSRSVLPKILRKNSYKMTSKIIQGFKCIPLRYSQESCSHELFIKEHSTRLQEDSKPPGRTLFVLNIPPYVTEDSLKNVFSTAGKVISIILQMSLKSEDEKIVDGFKVGYVVFTKREGMLKALKLNMLNYLSTEEKPLKTGLHKWISEYNHLIYNSDELQASINIYISQFDKSEQEKNKKQDEIDDEGWTVVTKKGRNPGLSRKESVEIKLSKKIKASSKKKELANFYRFQIRENKMKNLAVLRKNYEEAKKKVTLMKNARRFKPY